MFDNGDEVSMKIAVGTTDGLALCDHLARSSAFVVLEIQDRQVASKTVRERGTDACGNHKSFVDILEGCSAVLCGGIGQGAADALAAHGIEPIVAAGKHTVDEAVDLYLAGRLLTTDGRVCLCH
jgi:predicted Fe-Mo cluster-binding NifX family protein